MANLARMENPGFGLLTLLNFSFFLKMPGGFIEDSKQTFNSNFHS